jgi:hypothetical protein
MICRDSGVRFRSQPATVCSPSLLARPTDNPTTRRHERPATAFSCRHGYPSIHSMKSRRNGALWPSADARISSSSITAAAGGITTAKSAFSSIVCAKPSGSANDGRRLRRLLRERRRRPRHPLSRSIAPRPDARTSPSPSRIDRGGKSLHGRFRPGAPFPMVPALEPALQFDPVT